MYDRTNVKIILYINREATFDHKHTLKKPFVSTDVHSAPDWNVTIPQGKHILLKKRIIIIKKIDIFI